MEAPCAVRCAMAHVFPVGVLGLLCEYIAPEFQGIRVLTMAKPELGAQFYPTPFGMLRTHFSSYQGNWNRLFYEADGRRGPLLAHLEGGPLYRRSCVLDRPRGLFIAAAGGKIRRWKMQSKPVPSVTACVDPVIAVSGHGIEAIAVDESNGDLFVVEYRRCVDVNPYRYNIFRLKHGETQLEHLFGPTPPNFRDTRIAARKGIVWCVSRIDDFTATLFSFNVAKSSMEESVKFPYVRGDIPDLEVMDDDTVLLFGCEMGDSSTQERSPPPVGVGCRVSLLVFVFDIPTKQIVRKITLESAPVLYRKSVWAHPTIPYEFVVDSNNECNVYR
jgi:hypothetical protein